MKVPRPPLLRLNMGDAGDYWRDVKAHGKRMEAKYADVNARRHRSTIQTIETFIKTEGILKKEFTMDHWRFIYKDKAIDYWPTTGTFRSLSGEYLSGTEKLFTELEKLKNITSPDRQIPSA